MPVLNETVHHASGTYVAGCELADDHELVKAAPHLFADGGPVVETAAAEPGAKRSTRRPKAKPAE